MHTRDLTDIDLETARDDRRLTPFQRDAAEREIQRRKDQRRMREARAKIRTNIWGNTNGYISGRKVIEFGTDDILAQAWLDTARAGDLDHWEDKDFQSRAWLAAHAEHLKAEQQRIAAKRAK